jgi:hypothetical protein
MKTSVCHSFLLLSYPLPMRAFVSRLLLDILRDMTIEDNCLRKGLDGHMLGSGVDFWKYRSFRDLDHLLSTAVERLLLLEHKTREPGENIRDLVELYLHDLFPRYSPEHVDRVIEYLNCNSSSAPTLDLTPAPRSTPASHSTPAPHSTPASRSSDIVPVTKFASPHTIRPPLPRDSLIIRSSSTNYPVMRFVDEVGVSYFTDACGVVRWQSATIVPKGGGGGGGFFPRMTTCKSKVDIVDGKLLYIHVPQSVWVDASGRGEVELWPGSPSYHQVRTLVDLNFVEEYTPAPKTLLELETASGQDSSTKMVVRQPADLYVCYPEYQRVVLHLNAASAASHIDLLLTYVSKVVRAERVLV